MGPLGGMDVLVDAGPEAEVWSTWSLTERIPPTVSKSWNFGAPLRAAPTSSLLWQRVQYWVMNA